MKDQEDQAPAPADEAAAEAETPEQIWDEFEKSETEDPDASPPPVDPVEDPSDGAEDAASDDPPDADDTPDSSAEGDDNLPSREELMEQIERLQRDRDANYGRYKAERKNIRQLEDNLKAAEEKLAQVREEAEAREARLKKLADAKEEYGDIIGPLAEEHEQTNKRLDALASIEERNVEFAKRDIEAIKSAERATFLEAHPDGFDVVMANREAFNRWIEDQPKILRDAYRENEAYISDGASAALLVAHFKQALNEADTGEAEPTPKPPSRRQKQLESAGAVRNPRSKPVISDAPPETDDPQALWEYWERREKAS